MPQAQYELGLALDSPIDEIVADLKANGWSAQKGVRYGIPYLTIRRTGFQHVVLFDSWATFAPNLTNIPDDFMPQSGKYWCWSAIIDRENPNTTGFMHFDEENYRFKLRGVVNSLGNDFSAPEFREAVYMMLWDPCKIPNSFTRLKPQLKPESVCPVCTTPTEFKKVIKDGTFPADFMENFAFLSESEKKEKLTARFHRFRSTSNLVAAVPLGHLKDRFATEKDERTQRFDKALALQPTSNIPEHFLSNRKDLLDVVRTRTWLIHDSDPGVAHLGRDVNLGNLPVSNIPAIQTRCHQVWLTLPDVRDGDFGENIPCFNCFSGSFDRGSEKESGRRLTDLSWAESPTNINIRSGTYFNIGWGQPVLTPRDITDKASWYSNTIQSYGIFTLLFLSKFNKAFGLENEESDAELVNSLLKKSHPATFKCMKCEKEEFLTDLTEEFCTPASSSRYRFLVEVGSIVRLGPTTLCGDCRSNTYGTNYLDIGNSEEAFEALRNYQRVTGVIPDIDWRTRPMFRHLDTSLSEGAKQDGMHEAFKFNSAMPSGFISYLQGPKKYQMWKENSFNWWELLHRAGLVEKFKQTARGKQGVSEDGHLCLSMMEWRFCNLLHKNGVEHTKEPRYTTSNLTRADYLIGDLYIEIAGLLGDPEYEVKLTTKLLAAKERKQRVLVFAPKDIEDLMKLSYLDQAKLEELWRNDVSLGRFSSLAHH